MDLIAIHTNLKSISVIDIMVDTLDELDSFIADLNRDQLSKGKRDDGSDIEPEYTDLTKHIKSNKGGLSGVIEHVTLFDSGDLYKSIFTAVSYPEIILDSKDPKLGKLEGKYQNFLGLTKENQKKLKDKTLPLFWDKYYGAILR
jgi:hypothetical protein